MSIVSNNIKYLRRLNGLTQEQFARRIGIKRSLLGAYEEARANPNLDNLMSIARAFNTTVDNLLKSDLRKIRETPDLSLPLDRSAPSSFPASPLPKDLSDNEGSGLPPQALSSVLEKYYQPPTIKPPASFQKPVENQPQIKLVAQRIVPRPVSRREGFSPLAITAPQPAPQLPSFNNAYENVRTTPSPLSDYHLTNPAESTNRIQWVRKRQFNDYLQRYQHPDFLNRLATLQLPLLPPDHYRAFDAGDEFMYPGAVLIGKFVRNWYEIADGKSYVLLIQGQGVVNRRVFNQVKLKGTLLLSAEHSPAGTWEIAIRDVLEVWEVTAFISQHLPEPSPSLDGIRSLVEDLRYELDRIQKK